MRQTLKIGITLVVVAALTMSGIALAQTNEGEDTAAVEETRAYQAILEHLAPLIEDDTITEAQAEAVATALAENLRGPGGRGHGLRALRATAEFLELTPEEMREALTEYDTLADLAAAHGSSGAELIAYLVTQVEEHLATAVEEGRITEDEAAEKLADAEERITEMVNSDIPEPGEGRRGRGPRFGPGFEAPEA